MIRRSAFTLIELLVVVVITGILIALSFLAVVASREEARRRQCVNQLGQLGLALANYESALESLPPGVVDQQGPILSIPSGCHMSWIVQILPYIEQGAIFQHVDFKAGAYDPKNRPARMTQLRFLKCPTSLPRAGPESGVPRSDYAACHHDLESPIDQDNHGVFYLNSRQRSRRIPDGAAHTIYLGEKLTDEWELGWMSGTRSTLRNTGVPMGAEFAVPPLVTWPVPPVKPPQPDVSEPAAAVPPDVQLSPGTARDDISPDGSPPGLYSGLKSYWTIEELPAPEESPSNRPDQLKVGGFGSCHPGVSNFLTGDGAVHTLVQTIDFDVYQQLGHRDDGKLLLDPLP